MVISPIKVSPHLLDDYFSHCLKNVTEKKVVDEKALNDRLKKVKIFLENCYQRVRKVVFYSLAAVNFVNEKKLSFRKVERLFFDFSLSKHKEKISKKFSVLEEVQSPRLVFDYFKPFGSKSWEKHLGVKIVGKSSICPNGNDQTKFSVLMPSRVIVDGQEELFTLGLLGEIIKRKGLEILFTPGSAKKECDKIVSKRLRWVH